MATYKILYVEDELDDNPEDSYTNILLKNQGYHVTIARTGNEAWQLLMSGFFNLVLLDIMLPPAPEGCIIAKELSKAKRLDMGLELLKQLRSGAFEQTGTGRNVPVVVISAVTGVQRWESIRKIIGRNDWCLTKPCSPTDVLSVVNDALNELIKFEV